jgi:hypothetical protein
MRAQVWSMDFIGSVVIFFISVAVLMTLWNFSVYNSSYQESVNSMGSLSLRISDSLVRTPGLPEGWNASSVQAIGLASDENVLDSTKVDQLTSMDYATARRLLGTGAYEFYLDIRGLDGAFALNSSGQEVRVGIWPSSASNVVSSERYVLYRDVPARLRLVLWY